MASRSQLEIAFGEVLRELRTAAHMSQEQLAEAANLHRNYVGLVERGANSPSLAAVTRLANALRTSPSELIRLAEAGVQKPDGV